MDGDTVTCIDSVISQRVVEMTRAKTTLFAALAICALMVACGPTWYSIVLTPRGPIMERMITQTFGPEEYERVALLYSPVIDAGTLAKFEDAPVQSLTLTGRFGPGMPADSNNRGMYSYCESPLGTSAMYTERFGGRHDLAATLNAQEERYNLLWDIVLLLVDDLVGEEDNYAELRSFLDTTMRADLWDLTLELTIADLGDDSMTNLSYQDEIPDDLFPKSMRAIHFLDARGYVSLEDLLVNPGGMQLDDDWSLLAREFGKAIGRRMGLEDGTLPPPFEALLQLSEDDIAERIMRFLEEDPRVGEMLAAFRLDFDGMIDAEPGDSLETLATQAFLFDFDLLQIGGDARKVTLYIGVEPYLTNGAWFEASKTDANDTPAYVEWSYPLAKVAPRGELAQVVYAYWAEPATDYQAERFGAQVLEGEQLANQCEWRQLLGASLRDEWDAFIDGLRPGPDLENTLNRFRFSIEEPPESGHDPNVGDSAIARPIVQTITPYLPKPPSPVEASR